MPAVGQIHLFFHSTDIRQAGRQVTTSPYDQASPTRKDVDQTGQCGVGKPNAAQRDALYRPGEPCRQRGADVLLNDPYAGKVELAGRFGQERSLPFAGLRQDHRPLGMECRKDETREPCAATDIEKPWLTAPRKC